MSQTNDTTTTQPGANQPPIVENQNPPAQADPNQNQPTQNQPTQDQQQPSQQQPNAQAKPSQKPDQQPKQDGPAPAPVQQTHPLVSAGKLIHQTAETLAGGPRFKESVDINTGKTVRTKIPMSRADIGMAIAMSAISGALAGASQTGPNHVERAAMAGAQATMAQRQQEDQQQQQRSSDEFARHYQVAEANMRMLSLAQTVGRSDLDAHEELVKGASDHIKYLRDTYPELIAQDHATEEEAKDLQKYPLNEYYRVPDGVTPRLNENGSAVYLDEHGRVVPANSPGAHAAYDNTYSMIHKNAKVNVATDGGPQQWVKDAVKWGVLPDGWNKVTGSTEISGPTAAAIMHKTATLSSADKDLKQYYSTLNRNSGTTTYGSPQIADAGIASIVDSKAKQYGIPEAVLRGLILTESGDPKSGKVNPRAVSPKGAQGLGQLMPDTAKSLGVTDPFDPTQNVDGAARFLKSLIDKKHGDVKAALAAYHGIGSDGITTHDEYVQKIMDTAGAQDVQADQTPVDLQAEIKNDPTLANALDKFQGLLNQTGSREQAIGELAKKDPRAAGKVARLYGGTMALHQFDQLQKLQDQKLEDQRKLDYHLQQKTMDESFKTKEGDQMWQRIGIPKDTTLRGDDLLRAIYKNDVGAGSRLEAITNYELKESDISNRADRREFYYGLAKLINPNFDATDLDKKVEMKRSFFDANGKTQQGLQALNSSLEHMQSAYDHVSAMATIPGLKSISDLSANKQAAAYNASKELIVQEVARAYKNGVIDKEERDSFLTNFEHYNPNTIRAKLQEMARDLEVKINNVYEANKGIIPGDYQTVKPRAAAAYKHITGEDLDQQLVGDPNAKKPHSFMLTQQYSHTTKDGKFGYDGKQWVPIQKNTPAPDNGPPMEQASTPAPAPASDQGNE